MKIIKSYHAIYITQMCTARLIVDTYHRMPSHPRPYKHSSWQFCLHAVLTSTNHQLHQGPAKPSCFHHLHKQWLFFYHLLNDRSHQTNTTTWKVAYDLDNFVKTCVTWNIKVIQKCDNVTKLDNKILIISSYPFFKWCVFQMYVSNFYLIYFIKYVISF